MLNSLFRRVLNARTYLLILMTTIGLLIFLKPNKPNPVVYVPKPTVDQNHQIDLIFKSVQFGNQRRTSYTTVVTTLYRFGKSKHSSDSYERWSETMISSMGATLIAFVDSYWAQKLVEKCKQNNLTGTIFISNSIWDVMRLLETSRKRNYTENYLQKQPPMDPEKHIHSPELYAVWNLKHFLLDTVAALNPYHSEFFIYSDCGAWRGRKFSNWPDETFVRALNARLRGRILYGQIRDHDSANFNPRTDLIEGTFFAGNKEAISKASDNFYSLHDEWLDKGIFIGKDQTLMNELAFMRANSSIVRVKTIGLNCSQWYDEWFFYQYYFAKREEFICSNDKLSMLSV